MTNQEAIEELKARKEHYEMGDGCEVLVEALEKGIEALENQNSVIEELEKIKYEMLLKRDSVELFQNVFNWNIELIDKRIAKLKGD